LKEQGSYVVTVEHIDWYDYNGFMVPAYLPHNCPEITQELAVEVLRESGRPFVRWDSQLGQIPNSDWWYVIHKGPWSLERCSGNTRSKIRRGRKQLYARVASPEEILRSGYAICKKAEKRYEKGGFVPSRETYERKVQAATKINGVLEFFGVFSKKNLVGYSENYIQDNAVFSESIWYDPEFLRKYSSYVLIDEMLHYYLDDKRVAYISDGCRSIYHRTAVQDYLINVFGFTKEYALLNVVYSSKFQLAIKLAYPFRGMVWSLCDKWTNITVDKIGAVLRQEYIQQACKKQGTHNRP
jgi:hypothetical protein